MSAQIEIIAAAHFYKSGARGMNGGAAQNDKVWGLAKIGNTLVRFWGRRNGQLKFKTEINGIPHDLLREKLDKGYETMGGNYMAMLTPRLKADMPSQYYSAMSRGQLNTRH
jgi:hypothetical protein